MRHEIVILGAGESGTGAALLAQAKGFPVFVSEYGPIAPERKRLLENKAIPYEEGGHNIEKILNADLIIKSPGIPPSAPVIQAAKKKGIEIIDELEFAYRFTSAKIIAITGTNGKTTTTLLTYHILKEAGLDVGLAGNVGHSLAAQLVDGDRDYFVVEISSFQLDGTHTFRPHIAMLLNITPDHLDRYDYSFDKYVASKFRITKNQTPDEYLIINSDEISIENWQFMTKAHIRNISLLSNKNKSAWYQDGILHFQSFTVPQKETALLGRHNAANMLCAVEAARLCRIPQEIILKALQSFKNAPHRLELVGEINHVKFYNDSKATNVDAVKYALGSFDESLVWIAGGIDKGNNYDLIMDEVNRKVKALICLGSNNKKLRDAFHDKIIHILETQDVHEAVAGAMKYAEANDVVLLSPACASFDLFKNYEDRGNQFREAVKQLKVAYEQNPHQQ